MLKRAVKNAPRAATTSSGSESDRRPQPRARRAPAASSSADDDDSKERGGRQKSSDAETARTKKTRSKRSIHSESESDTKRRGAATSGTDTPRSRSTAAFRSKVQSKLQRMWNAGKMKRTPLLERATIEAVHSALAGKDKKRSRTKLLELFARYDTETTGSIDDVRFVKSISKVGVHLTKAAEYDALVSCFAKSPSRASRDGDSSDERSASRSRTAKLVDYAAFIDFASNVRDSERLSAIADKLSRSIDKYDDKHDQSTTTPFDIHAALAQLDRKKRQWLPSEVFAAFLAEHERPVFKLSSKDITALTERFEYEYDAGALGVDYEQFARWIQPQLHLDVKALHRRVRDLVQMVHDRSGWDVNDVFRAIDRNGDGDVSCAELKDALLEMGLPLTDAQIRCLLDEYDSSGDGRVQLNEFTALFPFLAPATTAKSGKRAKRGAEDRSDEDSDGRRSKTRASSNGKKTKNTRKNTFSWDIGKAFARKQPARGTSTTDAKTKAKPSASAAAKNKKRATVSSPDDDSDAVAQQSKRSSGQRKPHAAASSDSETSESSRRRQAKTRGKRTKHAAAAQSSTDAGKSSSESSSERSRRQAPRPKAARSSRSKASKRTGDATLTDTESDRRVKTTRSTAKRSNKRAERTASTDDEAKASSSSSTDSPAARSSSKKSKSKMAKAATAASPRRRRERQRSTVSAVSHRSTKGLKSPSKTGSRRASGASVTAQNTRQSRSQRVQRTRSRSRTRQRHRSSVAFDGSTSSAGDSEASSSGLDVEQLRQLKRTTQHRAMGDRELDDDALDSDASDDNDGVHVQSRSDGEYEKHLKRSLRRAFDFFDLDQSDAIEKRELSHVLRALGHEFTTDELDAAMRRADVDQNGALDFREFVAFVKRELRHKQFVLSKRREMEIRQAFESLDADRNGVLDENEFEYLVYKVLGVELSVEEQDALLDFVDENGDGCINEDEFIAFMKVMESFHSARVGTRRSHTRAATEFLESLDGTSRLAMQAMKKLVRGAPIDLDRNLLMFFGVPTNFRPAISSAATCRALQANTLAHVLSFPSPQMVVALGQDPSLDAGDQVLTKASGDGVTEYSLLQQAESYESHAIVSLKRAVGVPKPFDTREDDVLKRCVHVCLFQEQETLQSKRQQRRQRPNDSQTEQQERRKTENGAVVGNVHEIPVYWHAGEEDVWEFSKKATKEDKYKFLVRTNSVNDHLYLLVEFVVVLRIATRESEGTMRRRKHRLSSKTRTSDASQDMPVDVREMVSCWCKVPIRTLLAKRVDVFRSQLKLWGGTAHAPIDIEQDEVLRRRTGWRALTNVFKAAVPPGVGIKSAPVERFGADIQQSVRKMPATLIAPFLALPILAEYMTLMKSMLASAGSASAGRSGAKRSCGLMLPSNCVLSSHILFCVLIATCGSRRRVRACAKALTADHRRPRSAHDLSPRLRLRDGDAEDPSSASLTPSLSVFIQQALTSRLAHANVRGCYRTASPSSASSCCACGHRRFSGASVSQRRY